MINCGLGPCWSDRSVMCGPWDQTAESHPKGREDETPDGEHRLSIC